MGELIAAGAGKEISNADRRHQPAEHDGLKRTRRSSCHKIEWQDGEREKPAEHAWRNEPAVACDLQQIIARRRMHQRVDILANRSSKVHVYARPLKDALPL